MSHIISASRLVLPKLSRYPIGIINGGQQACISMKLVQSKDEIKDESMYTRNQRIGRPQSPDLSVFKFEMNSILSISHRISGIALTSYFTILGFGAICSPHDFNYYVQLIEAANFSTPTLMAGKFMIAFPFTFHFVNGIRHLIWDIGKCLTVKNVYSTGYGALASSIVLSTLLTAL